MSNWTHAQCERCWCDQQGEWTDDDRLVSLRQPTMVRSDDFDLRPCCFCGGPTFVGIFVRHDPAKLPLCQGHDDE